MSRFVHIDTISRMYDFLGSGEPAHPLIAVVRAWPKSKHDITQIKFTSALYYIAMKSNKDGAFRYGRSSYDYQKGTMIFIGPGQVVTFSAEQESTEDPGWTILFHPDLVRKTPLEQSLHSYSFFNYEINEALHLSEKERDFLTAILSKIEQEINQNLDRHSVSIVAHHLETILKYSHRYYERQFYTRTHANKDCIVQFEVYLKNYFNSSELSEKGVPSVEQCGKALHMSPSYLSDLLRAETGKSAKVHIQGYLIDLAKSRLLGSDTTVSEIAYALGFAYPQHFSKLFKSKTGLSPSEYRKIN